MNIVLLSKIIDLIENLSILEINELIKILEQKYNIKFNLNIENNNNNIKNEKLNNYSIYLIDIGKSKVSIIKILKEINNLGLKEAKDLAENCPSLIKKGISIDLANSIKEKLDKLGAKSEIKENE